MRTPPLSILLSRDGTKQSLCRAVKGAETPASNASIGGGKRLSPKDPSWRELEREEELSILNLRRPVGLLITSGSIFSIFYVGGENLQRKIQ